MREYFLRKLIRHFIWQWHLPLIMQIIWTELYRVDPESNLFTRSAILENAIEVARTKELNHARTLTNRDRSEGRA